MCFIFFALATFIAQVTMFNMLIAIMGDTFERIMEFKEVNSIKSKLDLMSDLNATMRTKDRTENKEIFFYLVHPEDLEYEDEDD